MNDLVYIASIGIKDLITKIPAKNDEFNPNINAGYFGELINQYFSPAGFYKIIQNTENKIIDLEKLSGAIKPKTFENIKIIFPENIFALQKFVNNGVSVVKGEINSRKFEGTLKKHFENEYVIYITKEIKE